MPEYSFHCDGCGLTHTRDEPMNAEHRPGSCHQCGRPLRRLYDSRTVVDEIRGTNYFHPTKRMEVHGHGATFDIGLGKWYSTKQERRNLIKKAGFQEWGPREV